MTRCPHCNQRHFASDLCKPQREAMSTKTKTKLYAVRFKNDNQEGVDLYEHFMGTDPAVYPTEYAANLHMMELNIQAELLDWDGNPPVYYIEEITPDEMWPAEEVGVVA